ncbi:MAG TPA: dihydrodipicolinate synthase family protein [Acidobacteriaceae bacterium]|nr:dihydrodipicolinate synthase family protein [Acidobacteriaceae bacterium]
MIDVNELRGVLPVLQTPFQEDESVDLSALRAELDWMAAQGVDGFTFGMVSEILRLSSRERVDVATVTCTAAVEHGLPAVISVGAESTRQAVQLAMASEEAGAAALMAIPPIAVTLPEIAVKEYYTAILEATSIPLVIQDASGYVGRPLSIELLVGLFTDYPERVLFKPEAVPLGPRLTALRIATSGQARVFDGTGGIALIDSYRRGIVGTMPGADLCWALVTMWGALTGGDFVSAYEIAGPLIGLIALQPTLDSFVLIEKYLLHKQGVLPNAIARKPLSFCVDSETRDEADRLFEQLRRATDVVRRRNGLKRPGGSPAKKSRDHQGDGNA